MSNAHKLFNYYCVDVYGNVSEFSIDFSKKIEYHGRKIPLYSDFLEDHVDYVKVAENYGAGAVELTLYRNKRFAELVGTEIKYKKLVEKIRKLVEDK